MRVIRTNWPRIAAILMLLFASNSIAPAQSVQNTPAAPVLHGIYFTETGCSHCDAFLYVQKQRLEEKYRVRMELETHDILSSEGYALCVRMLESRHLKFTVFPVLFMGSNIYRGSSAIENNVPEEIEYFLAHATYRPAMQQIDEHAALEDRSPRSFGSTLLPTLFAGLLDGINPCAFSTMLFFLSFIALRRTDRRSLFLVGTAFIAAVFIAYFLIGLGFLGALRAFLSERRFARYMNIFVSALAALFAIMNIRDAFAAAKGRISDSSLQLPAPLKRLNHAVIRHFNRLPMYVLGAAISGFLVSIIELACTGQIYLPTIAYMNKSARSSASMALLVAYNIAFIAPLSLIFALYLSGIRHESIRRWYGSHLVPVRVLSALFFLMLGILVWII